MTELAQEELKSNSRQPTTNSDAVTVAEWPINKREDLRVTIEKYNGMWLFNLRKWFRADSGDMRPGKRGIAVSVKHLPQLADAVTTALAVARERGLLKGSNDWPWSS